MVACYSILRYIKMPQAPRSVRLKGKALPPLMGLLGGGLHPS